jgi:Na+-transporting NADH:ubiquinone oxidoreductase subunit C
MVLVVASTLAFTASSLKSLQADNVRKEKMQNILSTIGIQTDREKAEQLYKNYINATLSLDHMGNVDETVDAFQIKLNYEIKTKEGIKNETTNKVKARYNECP